MKESINSSVVQTTQFASNMWFADITGEAEKYAYKNEDSVLTHDAGRERYYRIFLLTYSMVQSPS